MYEHSRNRRGHREHSLSRILSVILSIRLSLSVCLHSSQALPELATHLLHVVTDAWRTIDGFSHYTCTMFRYTDAVSDECRSFQSTHTCCTP